MVKITCPTKYCEEASSINLKRSSIYGLGVIWVSIKYRLQKMKLANFRIFKNKKSFHSEAFLFDTIFN